MRSSNPVTLLFCVLALLVGVALTPQTARALIIDFSALDPGDTGSHTYTNGPVTVEAFYKDLRGVYINDRATLFVNTTVGERGFGVCSPFPGCTDPNDELDDHFLHDEMIRLTLEPGWRWVGASVSSLGVLPGDSDTGRLYTGTSPDFGSATLLATFSASRSTTELDLPITGPAADAQYLFFIPEPGPPGSDDYLVWKVGVEVPEPTTLLLLGAGFAVLGAIGWKRSSRK